MHDDHLARIIRKGFCAVFCPCRDKHRRIIRKVSAIHFGSFIFQSDGEIMLTIKDTEVPGSGTYKFSFKDAKGKTAKVDGLPTITASDNSVVDSIGPVTDNGDGTFSLPFHLTDNPGTSQVIVNADVDLGEGSSNKDFIDVVNIIPGDAVAIAGDFGAVTPDA